MRPHLLNGQMLQRHQHYHQAWICTINFRDLVSILSSWLAGLNSNVMPQNRIFCLLATTHGKNSYWGISYNSGYEVIYCRCLLNYIQKKQGRSPFLTLEVLPEFDFGHQTLKSDNFIELSISCTLGLRSFYTILHHITMVLRLHISRDESFTFLWAIGSTQNTSKWISLDFKARKGKGNTHWVPTCIPTAYHQPRRVHDSVFFPISLFHPLRWATLLSYSQAPNGGMLLSSSSQKSGGGLDRDMRILSWHPGSTYPQQALTKLKNRCELIPSKHEASKNSGSKYFLTRSV